MSENKQLKEKELVKVNGGETAEYAGGIIGENKQSDNTIKDCANILGKKDENEPGYSAGGIIGNTNGADLTIKDCNNVVDSNKNSSTSGGLIGGNVGGVTIKI